jgi:hypothetical protein
MKPLNNQGSILIVSLVILYLLTSQSVSFSLFDASELNESKRYCNSAAAFWLAEAGANMYMRNPTMLDKGPQTIVLGGGTISLSRDDSKPLVRLVHSSAIYQGVKKSVQLTYSANVPEVYKNTISSKGDLKVTGMKTSVLVNDRARLTGAVVTTNTLSSIFFEDQQAGVDPSLTTLNDPAVPPIKEDGKVYEQWKAFVESNKNLVNSYPSEEVVYLTGQDTYTIDKDTPLKDKKIIFVEGFEKGGNVVIESSEFLSANQNLTVIASGTVTFNQSGEQAANSQLNVISWGGYTETASAPSVHRGIIYTRGVAKFDQIKENSTTNGIVIADGGIEFGEIWSTKVFNYADLTRAEVFPPGFERLKGTTLEANA